MPIPILFVPAFTTNILAESFDSTRKSTSALSSLKTAPPLAYKAPLNVPLVALKALLLGWLTVPTVLNK